MSTVISPPALREAHVRRAYVVLLFLYVRIFSDFCETNYLNIYQPDVHEICRIAETFAVDEQTVSAVILPRCPMFLLCFYCP